MTDPSRPLDVARADLSQRTFDAERMEQWQERSVLANLADVADMVCRIGDHPHSAHYRAEKAGRLVGAALDVQWECLNAYAGESADGDIVEELERANDVIQDVAAEVRAVMWAITRGDPGVGLYVSDTRGLRRASSAFARWAGGVADRAVPDPADDLSLPEVEHENRPDCTQASLPGSFGPADRYAGIDHRPGEGVVPPSGAVPQSGRTPDQGNEAGPW